MADLLFEDPRLVSLYDAFDGERRDLDHYLAIARELAVRSVLDVGCGTGSFASLLAQNGFEVTGVEPAQSSLELARQKPGADRVRWIHGDARRLPDLDVDLAVMTGNVAQVFLTDEEWLENLAGVRKALRPGGHLVFEVRNPEQKAWLEWTRERTYRCLDVPGAGRVESWCQVTEATGDRVGFVWTYVFASDGQVLTSSSTLRFREKSEIADSLEASGFVVREIRDAPDRPGREWVFLSSLRNDRSDTVIY